MTNERHQNGGDALARDIHDEQPQPERTIYHPLTWRGEKPAKFRGKDKRSTRRDAIARKRGQHGNALIDALVLAALLALLWVLL